MADRAKSPYPRANDMSPEMKENVAMAMGQMVDQSLASGLMCWS